MKVEYTILVGPSGCTPPFVDIKAQDPFKCCHIIAPLNTVSICLIVSFDDSKEKVKCPSDFLMVYIADFPFTETTLSLMSL